MTSSRFTFDSAAIATATGGSVVRPGPAGRVTAHCIDVQSGEWFVALTGDGYDDHVNVPNVVAKGVAGVIVQHPIPVGDVGMVVVEDTWRAMADLARTARRRFSGPLVGITGSTGKTTTRDLVGLALSVQGSVYRTDMNNSRTGTLHALLGLPDTVDAAVLELASFKPGEIAYLASVTEPSCRVVVSVGPAHLERLGDLGGVEVEKRALFDAARPGDRCVVNLDDVRTREWTLPEGTQRITHGLGGDIELVRMETDLAALCTKAEWRTPQGMVSARLPSIGPVIARNAAIALAVAWGEGVDLAAAAQAFEQYTPTGPRLRVERQSGGLLIDDTYNANPVSMRGALDLLATLPGHRTAVLGDMLELGAASAEYHRDLAAVAEQVADQLILVGPAFGAVAPPGAVVVDTSEAVPELQMGDGRVVLLKGSRKMALDTVADRLRNA
ncbi:MAG: Mur ligase family protein [Myxococcota bacterium]